MKTLKHNLAILALPLLTTPVFAQFNPAALKSCAHSSACFRDENPQSSFSMVANPRSRKVVVLFHGLSDSPFYMKDVARIFRAHGYDVVAPTLDGHGTKPEDLLEIESKQWTSSTDAWIAWAQKNWSKVSVGGFSTGGALSLRLAALNPELQSVFLFAPAVKIKDPKASQSCIPFAHKMRKDGKWVLSSSAATPVKYNKKTLASICALYKVGRQIEPMAEKIKQPIWTAVSSDDDTVSSVSTLSYLNQTPSQKKSILVVGSDQGMKTLETEMQTQNVPVTGIVRGQNIGVAHGEITLQDNRFNPSQKNNDFKTLEESLKSFLKNSGPATP